MYYSARRALRWIEHLDNGLWRNGNLHNKLAIIVILRRYSFSSIKVEISHAPWHILSTPFKVIVFNL